MFISYPANPAEIMSNLCKGGNRLAALVLYLLCGSLAFYPLLLKIVSPVIWLSFLSAFVIILVRLSSRGFRMPSTFLVRLWTVFFGIYITWFLIALLRGNKFDYIIQDSLGFNLYLGVMPVVYLLVVLNSLQAHFIRFIEGCSIAISGLSILLVAGYFLVYGPVDGDSLIAVNVFVKSLGLRNTIDNNLGVLGLYTNIAHILLLGMAVALYRYSQFHRVRDLLLIFLYFIGMACDGRRALLICALLQLLIVARSIFASMPQRMRITLFLISITLCVLAVVLNLDWIENRFVFSEVDPSSAQRYAQIPALLDKILENPLIGGGFGTAASYIRSADRPFSYEVDFLATFMKLGVIGAVIYFGSYLYGVSQALKIKNQLGLFLFSAGLSFFFYMGSNGNQAMSTDSALFHVFLFIMISFSLQRTSPLHLSTLGISA